MGAKLRFVGKSLAIPHGGPSAIRFAVVESTRAVLVQLAHRTVLHFKRFHEVMVQRARKEIIVGTSGRSVWGWGWRPRGGRSVPQFAVQFVIFGHYFLGVVNEHNL